MLRRKLKSTLERRLRTSKYIIWRVNGTRHQTVDSDEVAFLMVNNNATTVEKALDGIRERRQKFVCLNDNLNHSDPSARDVSKYEKSSLIQKVVRVMKAFYESLYALPSSFELPPGVINEHLWMDEIISRFVF